MKVGIIGSGIAGLAASIRMACRGYAVEVFEKNNYPGGKLSSFTLGKYRFDAGPSLFTMPQYVTELFELAGEPPSFEYSKLPIICHYFWEDQTRIKAYADQKLFFEAINENIGPYAAKVEKFLNNAAKKYELTGHIFLEKSLHQFSTWFQKDVAKALMHLPSFDLFRTMNKTHEDYLEHPKLVQLFNRFATYNGSNPYKAPGLLSMIPHFEHSIGAFFPKGGMHSITTSLYELACRLGVKFHFNQKVDRIIVKGRKAVGLNIADKFQPFDTIISNMDAYYTYKLLLPDQKPPLKILNQEKSTSALIFYWGIKSNFDELGVHNILFSDDYFHEFDELNKASISADPTIYINITQKFNKGDAPEGRENWFTMINTPYDAGQSWEVLIPKIRNRVIQKINRILNTNIEQFIEEEEVLSPPLIEQKTSSHLGALYGTSSNNKMAAFLRHPNFSSRIQQLYFCGGSVHPGGGIPLCLLSAKIVDEVMHQRSDKNSFTKFWALFPFNGVKNICLW